jgi:hypothetical protein
VAFEADRPIQRAELIYTTDPKDWVQCQWLTVEARVDEQASRATADLPPDCAAWFINLIDDRDLLVSSICETVRSKARRR